MRPTKSLLYFLALIIMQSCSSTKDVFRAGELLEVKTLSVQKIVPGMPDTPPYHQLIIQVAFNDSDLILDSVYYQSKVYSFVSTSMNKIILTKTNPSSDQTYSEDPESAVIFYHVANKNYYQIHDEVVRLDNVYMP